MSTADKNDPIPFTLAQAKDVVAYSVVDRFMRRQFTIDAVHWDIPYLAGYSKDGSTIYIDRNIGVWQFRGSPRVIRPFLTLHEHVEKSVIDALSTALGRELDRLLILLRMESADDRVYYHAHGVATAVEEYAVKMQFGQEGLDSYNSFMKTQVKTVEDERIRRVPADLDMTPYQGSDAKDVALRHLMEWKMQS